MSRPFLPGVVEIPQAASSITPVQVPHQLAALTPGPAALLVSM